MSEKRVTLKGNPLSVKGTPLSVGDKAPEVTLADGWTTSTGMLEGTSGKVRLVSVVPCLFTGICDAQTRRMNEEAASLGDDVVVVTVSADPPPVQGNWCGAAGVDRVKMLSDHQEMAFGEAYGLWVEEMRAHQRAMFVIDKDDTIRYIEYVPEIAEHPDYDAAVEAVKTLL